MPSELFQSFHKFFYGSLMDSEVLQAILELPELFKGCEIERDG